LPKSKEQLAQEKQAVARTALRFVRSGMKLGLGSGSTSHCFIRALGQQVRSGNLIVEGIATSKESEEVAREAGIPLIEPARGLKLDFAVDGADEMDADLALIKGGGGALLREKVVEHESRYFLVIADSSKLVEKLGAFKVPVEVIPFSLPWVMDELEALGGKPLQRMEHDRPDRPYVTDQQNYIVDCDFGLIADPRVLARQLEQIPGIAEHGLFVDYANAALIADGDEVKLLRPGEPPRALEQFNNLP
jgi:ribose 5-phosphate isomerase A